MTGKASPSPPLQQCPTRIRESTANAPQNSLFGHIRPLWMKYVLTTNEISLPFSSIPKSKDESYGIFQACGLAISAPNNLQKHPLKH
jgi:hypothetical protein